MNKSNYVSLSETLVKDVIMKQNDKGSDYVLFTLSVPPDRNEMVRLYQLHHI